MNTSRSGAVLAAVLLTSGCGRGCASVGGPRGSSPTGSMHPPAGFTAAMVGVGSNHVCALDDHGAVSCWGRDNGYGQLGDGTESIHRDPRPVPGLHDAISLAVGFQHACALIRGGEVRCWGENRAGQLGDGTRVGRASPVRVIGLPRARAIHAGPLTTCAEVEAGGLWCWGQLPATGSEPDAWSGSYPEPNPKAIPGLTTPLAGLSIAFAHLCAIAAGGEIECWGNGYLGELGDGTDRSRVLPGVVPGLPVARAAAAGQSFSCALTGDDLQCWGHGFPHAATSVLPPSCDRAPCVVARGGDLIALAAGQDLLCAVDRLGGVRCLGDNGLTLPGGVTTWLGPRLAPVPFGAPASAISLGPTFGCVRAAGGAITCFDMVERPRSGPPAPGRPPPRR